MKTQKSNNITKVFDRDIIANRLEKNASTKIDFVSKLVNDDLLERLKLIKRNFKNAIIIGPIEQNLPRTANSATDEISFTRFATLKSLNKQNLLHAENLFFPKNNYDLIISLLDLQIVNNVPSYLQNIHKYLAPDGLMISALIGANSLIELRSAWLEAESEIYGGATTRIAPFIDIKQAGTLLQHSGFTLPVIDIEHYEITYASPIALMKELKNLSASNPLFERPTKPVTKALLATAVEKYNNLASNENNRIRATLDILWLSGWAQHASQQKPLRPGSAKISLSKIL